MRIDQSPSPIQSNGPCLVAYILEKHRPLASVVRRMTRRERRRKAEAVAPMKRSSDAFITLTSRAALKAYLYTHRRRPHPEASVITSYLVGHKSTPHPRVVHTLRTAQHTPCIKCMPATSDHE